uniref:Uncharacterized protein n=1 Tax=Prolemur simus TaxID=1328070 RepID=A0A8C9DD03_PROSS
MPLTTGPVISTAHGKGEGEGAPLSPHLPQQLAWRKPGAGWGGAAGLTQHLAEEQLLQVAQHRHHELWVHLEEGALLLALGGGHGPGGALLRLGLAGEQLIIRFAVVAHGRLRRLAERLDLRVGSSGDPARLPQAGRKRSQGGLGAGGRAALGLEKRVLRLGQRLGHQRSLTALGPHLAQALGRLGHVVAPLGFIELQLFLGVCEEREVGERLLLAQVGGGRPAGDTAVHAAGLEDLQLSRAGLGHAAAATGRLGALGQHAFAVRRRRRLPAGAPRLVRALVPAAAAAAAQLLLGLRVLTGLVKWMWRPQPCILVMQVSTLHDFWVLVVSQDSALHDPGAGLRNHKICKDRDLSRENTEFSSREVLGQKQDPRLGLGDTRKDGDSALKELKCLAGNTRQTIQDVGK